MPVEQQAKYTPPTQYAMKIRVWRSGINHINKSQIRSLEYVLNNTFRKIFPTKSFDVATECVLYLGCAVQETLCWRKSKFLMKIKYKTISNLLYHDVQKVASDELAERQKLMQ